jgi:hypothetical protein
VITIKLKSDKTDEEVNAFFYGNVKEFMVNMEEQLNKTDSGPFFAGEGVRFDYEIGIAINEQVEETLNVQIN